MSNLTAVGGASAETRPSRDSVIQAARSFQPLLRDRVRQTEIDRRVSADVIGAIHQSGLTLLTRPARFGGYEYGPGLLIDVGAELAQACPSTAWCTMLANCNAWYASYWPLETQQAIWGDNPDAAIVGTVAPTGRCEKVDGGYHISGRWPWASNCDNSNWAYVSAFLPPVEGEAPAIGWFMCPLSELSIDQDSWHMSGMQGTGSKTLFADRPVFIPEHRTIRFPDILSRRVPGNAIENNPLANLAFPTFGALALIGPVIGMAQGALHAFSDTLRQKAALVRPGGPPPGTQSSAVQEVVGQALTRIGVARDQLLAEVMALEEYVLTGHAPTIEERLRIRRATVFAAEECRGVVNRLLDVAGPSSFDLTNPLQRFWRDINVASRHIAFDASGIYRLAGQHMFGANPIGNY